MSEREKQIPYFNVYMWHLENQYRQIYLQGRNTDTNVENGHVTWRSRGRGTGKLELMDVHCHV